MELGVGTSGMGERRQGRVVMEEDERKAERAFNLATPTSRPFDVRLLSPSPRFAPQPPLPLSFPLQNTPTHPVACHDTRCECPPIFASCGSTAIRQMGWATVQPPTAQTGMPLARSKPRLAGQRTVPCCGRWRPPYILAAALSSLRIPSSATPHPARTPSSPSPTPHPALDAPFLFFLSRSSLSNSL